jgi:hypothetical protein
LTCREDGDRQEEGQDEGSEQDDDDGDSWSTDSTGSDGVEVLPPDNWMDVDVPGRSDAAAGQAALQPGGPSPSLASIAAGLTSDAAVDAILEGLPQETLDCFNVSFKMAEAVLD